MANKLKCKHCGEKKENTVKIGLSNICQGCKGAYLDLQYDKKFKKDLSRGIKLQKEKAKKRKEQSKAGKIALMSYSDHAKKTQKAFNEWIRLRDDAEPCISCGKNHNGQYHAGHYRTVGAHPELRFNPLNCHKQCAPCNNHLSGNILEYRISLIKKIGIEKVELLEGPHEFHRPSIKELNEMEKKYKALSRQLKKEIENHEN